MLTIGEKVRGSAQEAGSRGSLHPKVQEIVEASDNWRFLSHSEKRVDRCQEMCGQVDKCSEIGEKVR